MPSGISLWHSGHFVMNGYRSAAVSPITFHKYISMFMPTLIFKEIVGSAYYQSLVTGEYPPAQTTYFKE
jgi:hypothetical protein